MTDKADLEMGPPAAAAVSPEPDIDDSGMSGDADEKKKGEGEVSAASRSVSKAAHASAIRDSVVGALNELTTSGGETLSYDDIERFTDEEMTRFVERFQPKDITAFIEAGRSAGWLPPAVNLSFRNLFYKRDGSVLLNGVSGYVRSGEVMAVMGPGSTAFFEVLADRQHGGRLSGEILVDHRPPDESFDRIVGYVTREDVHLPLLTVRETIMLSTTLRAGDEVPLVVQRLRGELVMKMLGISHVADSTVGDASIRGISGGEKRRLSIAVEIVAGHAVILADLPTNGLDSATSLSILRNSRHAARAGSAMAYSIVQASPELYDEFDTVLCLCRNSVVYFGPPAGAVEFFERCGFERPHGKSYPDFVTEVLDTPERFYKGPAPAGAPAGAAVTYREAWDVMRAGYEESDEFARLGDTLWKELRPQFQLREEAPPPRFASTWVAQTKALLWRQVQITYRNKQAFVGSIARSVLLGVILGVLFFDLGSSSDDARARLGLLFFCMVFPVTSAFQAVPNYVSERAVFYEQAAASYYRKGLFWLSSEAASLPFVFLEVAVFSVIVYGLTGLRGGVFGSEFWFFLLVVYVTGLSARGYVFTVSFLSPNASLAQAIVPVIFVILMLVSGYLIPRDSIPAAWGWLYHMSFLTYAVRSMAVNEYTSLTFECEADNTQPCFGVAAPGTSFSGEVVLDFYDMAVEDEDFKFNLVGGAFAFLVFFNVTAFAASVLVEWSGVTDADRHADGAAGAGAAGVDDEGSRTAEPLPSQVTRPGGGAGGKNKDRTDNAGVIEFSHLTYSVPVPNPTPEDGRGKTVQRALLSDVSGYAVPGRMIALMGASGAGKSTLLDVLAGRKTGGTIEGDILVNGAPRDEFFSRASAYVEQFDSLIPQSTVREAVEFSARLRLPPDTSERAIQRAVDGVLVDIGLLEVADSRVGSRETGGLSPEMRKKVSIAIELVTSPGILFLDEPTTGLTSASAVSVMEATRRLADRVSVVCTVHQPSNEIVNMFDWMMLLQPGGRVVYFGPVDGLGDYFERNGLGRPPPGANITDFALEALKARAAAATDEQEDMADAYEKSPEHAAAAEALEKGVAAGVRDSYPTYDSRLASSWGTQFSMLLRRFMVTDVRERTGLAVRLISPLVLSLVLGTIFFQLGSSADTLENNNRISAAFFLVVYLFFGAQSILGKHAEFRPILFRERSSGTYSAGPFYCARVVSDLPVTLASSFIFAVLTFWMTDVVPEEQGPRFGRYLGMIVLTSMLAFAFMETMGAMGATAEIGTALGGFFTTIFMLFVGFLAQRSIIPDAFIWLYFANPLRYPLFYLLQLALNTGANGEALMDSFDVSPEDSSLYFLMTVFFYFFFRLTSYLLLRFVSHIKR